MSGFVGVWNLDGRPLDPAVLAAMSATLRHRGPDGEGRHLDGSFGLACQHQWITPEEIGERQPRVGGGVAAVIDGRLDNRDELLPALTLAPSATDAQCVRAAYEAWGERLAERLAGDFAFAVYDQPRRTLVLGRDGIGVRPLYYCHRGSLLAFASEIKALLAHPDIPMHADDEGLADFLLVGFRPVDRPDVTCFHGVSALVPAHVMVARPRSVATRRYWDFDLGRPLRLRSYGDYVEGFRERFAIAVRRRLRAAAPAVVSVSGGLDSSSIFCEGQALGRSGAVRHAPRGVSYVAEAGTDADEARYLTEIERTYAVSLDRFPLEPFAGLVTGTEEQVRAIEAPFLDYLWGVTTELYRRVAASGSRVLLSGHWGDQVLFSTAYLVDLLRRLAWLTVWRHLHEYGRWFGAEEARVLRHRFVTDVVRHHVPGALVPVLKRLKRRVTGPLDVKPWFSDRFLALALRHVDRPAMLGRGFHSAHARAIYLEARSKYHVQCLEWNNKTAARYGLTPAFPYLDRDLLAFLMAVPGEVQNRGGVPRALLRDAMRGVLPDPVRARTWKADFTAMVNQGVDRDKAVIVQAMTTDCLGVRAGYLDAGRLATEVARLSADLRRADNLSSWELADLYGFEVWLRVFSTRRSEDVSLSEAGVRPS